MYQNPGLPCGWTRATAGRGLLYFRKAVRHDFPARKAILNTPKHSGLWYKFVNGYVRFSYRQPLIPLILLGVMTWLAAQFSAKLRIDTDLRVLLPKGTASVVALQQAEKRMGSTDLFTIACQAPSLEAVGALQKAIADSLMRWKEVVWVQYDQDRSFFERHALL